MNRDSKPGSIPENSLSENNVLNNKAAESDLPNNMLEDKSGFIVQASPLNQIKLELGVILIMAVGLLLIIDVITDSRVSQMSILASFGLTSMVWLIIRVKNTVQKLSRSSDHSSQATTEK